MLSLNDLVSLNRRYRKYSELWDFEKNYKKYLKPLESNNNYQGYGVIRLFKCILLQFMEDLSDRELEIFLQENNAGKWFCEFKLSECTPDHSVFSKFRSQLKEQGYIMDRILVFDNGKIIEDGTQKNLLKANGHYARIWHMQAGGFLPDISSDISQ